MKGRRGRQGPDGIGRGGPALVGRERETRLIGDLIADASQRGGVLVVRGEAGIGKSALLAAAGTLASEHGMRVLTTAGIQSEAHLPFAGLHQLLRPVLAEASALPAHQRAALEAALGVADAAAPDQFLIALAVLHLLGDVAAKRPILVLAEDAQWLDWPTCEALAFVARRLESDPVVMLAAIREGHQSPFADAGLPEAQLGGLDLAAAAALLDSRAPGLSPGVRGRVLREAGGNPLALTELPVALESDQGTAAPALPQRLPLTTRLEQAFAERARGLPAAARTVLLVAAVDDEGSLGEVLGAAALVAGADPGVETLQLAVSARLVEADETELRFRHPLVRSAIRQAAGLADRQAAHAALAAVLDGQPDRRAWHLAASIVGPDEDVAAGLDAAAERAERRGGAAVAVAGLERAAQLTGDPARRGARLLRAAELAIDLGRLDVVGRLLRQAEPLALSALDLARWAWVREMSDPGPPGDPARVSSLIRTAEEMRQRGEADLALKLLWAAATSVFWAGRDVSQASAQIVAAAAALPAREDDPSLLSILAFADPVGQAATVIAGVCGQVPDDSADPGVMRLIGNSAATVGAFDLSEPYVTAAAAGLRRQGKLGLLAQVLVLRAWAEIHVGRWEEARSDAHEATTLAVETGQLIWAGGAQAAESILAGLSGDEAAAEALAEDAERVALPFGVRAVLSVVQLARGLTALGGGRHDDAYRHLARMFDPADPSFHPMESAWAIGNLAEAAVHTGHRLNARETLAELEQMAARTPSPWLHAAMRHARALLADDDAAEELFKAALDADLTRWPFERARALLAYGQWLRRRRRVAESRAPLRAARDAFDVLGTAAWGQRARQELRAAGEASRERLAAPWDKLSSQELQIARMAADGLTNRQISQHLYISPRTVGAHLYRIFPKLGVTARAQLATTLHDGGSEPG